MKIKQKGTKKQRIIKIIILIMLITILSGGTLGYLFISGNSVLGWTPYPKQQSSSKDNNPPSTEQINNGQNIKDQSIKNSGSSGSDQPLTPIPQTDGRNMVGLTITSIIKADASLIKISTLISYLDQSGSCSLVVKDSRASTMYSSTVGVQAMSSSSTCKGFDVPTTNLSPDTYTFNLKYTSADNKNYGSTEKNYVLQ